MVHGETDTWLPLVPLASTEALAPMAHRFGEAGSERPKAFFNCGKYVSTIQTVLNEPVGASQVAQQN